MTFGSACTCGRRALGDLLAEVEHRDRVAHAHDDVHVVLDQDHRDAVLADLADEADQLLDVGRGQAGGGLVEQQQLRVEREGARDLEQALLAVGQVARFLGRERAEADELEQAERARLGARRARAGSAAASARRSTRLLRKVWCRPTRTFCSAVISPNSCTFWNVRAMPESAMSDDVRPTTDLPANDDRACRRLVDAGQHVHHRALARAVRADQAVDRAALDDEVDVVERLQAAELHQHLAGLEDVAGRAAARRWSRRASAGAAAPVGHGRRDALLQVERVAHEADDAVLQVVDDEERDDAEDREPPVGHALQHERDARERDACRRPASPSAARVRLPRRTATTATIATTTPSATDT